MQNILFVVLLYLPSSFVESKVLRIYGSSKPQDVLANFYSSEFLNYSLIIPPSAKDELKFLHLDSKTGIMRLASKPDCKIFKTNPVRFLLVARTVKDPSLRTLESIKLHYHGGKCFYKFRRKIESNTIISRGATVGTRVFQLRDLFVASNPINPASLRLLNNKARVYFSIDSRTGHLLVRKSFIGRQERVILITVEFVPSKYLEVIAGRRNRSAILRVFIDDKGNFGNDARRFRRRIRNNPPQFASSQGQGSVSEDAGIGTTVTTVTATDPDSGSNGIVRYQMAATQNLMSQDYFSINAVTGVITTKLGLDRELFARHYFRITAKDQATPPLESTMDFTIIVQDVNDNSPVFESSIYAAKIPEDKNIGDFVLRVRARDEDDGSNARVRYCIVNNAGVNSAFGIDERTGVITVLKSLDREKVESYRLQIQGQDQGTPPKSATVGVKITLTDVNDCTPQFSKKVYKAVEREDVPVNKLVTTIIASDCDQGSNGEVFYEIVSGNDLNLFSINRINGEIRVKGKLDYERMPVFNLLVTAQDKGQPFLYNQTTVDITLKDVNDNAPQFASQHFQTMIPENLGVGQEFYRVQAYDIDDGTNGQIIFSLMRNDVPFAINQPTGGISITRSLDRETTPKFTFGIKARDKGVPPKEGTAQMTVTLLDVNDNPPKFSSPVYRTSVAENSRWGTSVLQVTARDPDSGPTNVVYSIEPGSSQQRCFRINTQGLITLSCSLNYKIKNYYMFTVSASDGMLSSTAAVYVNVTDAN